jgi:hypothetical protein
MTVGLSEREANKEGLRTRGLQLRPNKSIAQVLPIRLLQCLNVLHKETKTPTLRTARKEKGHTLSLQGAYGPKSEPG